MVDLAGFMTFALTHCATPKITVNFMVDLTSSPKGFRDLIGPGNLYGPNSQIKKKIKFDPKT